MTATGVRTAFLLALMACGLGACGYRGGLERPPPVFGEAAEERDRAVQERIAAERQAEQDVEEDNTREGVISPTER